MLDESAQLSQALTDDTEGRIEPVPTVSAGAMLAEARARLGLELEAVAQQLKIGVKQVAALELDDYGKLPGPLFVRGFLRNYARLLQIDPELLLDAYQQAEPLQHGPAPSIVPLTVVAPARRISGRVGYFLVALIVLLVGSWLGYALLGWEGAPSPLPGVAEVAPVPLSPPAPALAPNVVTPAVPLPPDVVAPAVPPAVDTGAPAVVGRIQMNFVGDAWVEIKEKGGRIVFSQNSRAGEERLAEGAPPFSLVVGNASNVKITYNGSPVDLALHTRANVARLTLE